MRQLLCPLEFRLKFINRFQNAGRTRVKREREEEKFIARELPSTRNNKNYEAVVLVVHLIY